MCKLLSETMILSTLLTSILIMLPTSSANSEANTAKATFAAGCFWCIQSDFDKFDGIVATQVGYTGGDVKDPDYKQVSAGGTGHVEAVEVIYDPAKISYDELLYIFWHNIDPFDSGGSFCDRGQQYRAKIFYHNSEQQKLAEKSKAKFQNDFSEKFVTPIEPASKFYPAEAYHQKFAKNNPFRYNFYRYACGRDKRLADIWLKD